MRTDSVLAWDRSDDNRRDTYLLLALFGLILLPAVLYITQYLTFAVALALMSTPEAAEELAADPTRTLGVATVIALLVLAVVLVAEYRGASALVLRITGARPVARQDEPELWRLVENLCLGTGLPHPGVYVIESDATNSLSTGLAPDSASLVITRGLLELLERRELEGVMAQELSQIGNRDTRLKTVIAALVATLWLPGRIVLRFFRFLFGLHWVLGVGCLAWLGLPLFGGLLLTVALALQQLGTDPGAAIAMLGALFLPIYAFVVAPLAGLAIQNAISRERELLADSDAVLLTRNPAGLLGALRRIRDRGTAELQVSPATAHLFLVDPRPATSTSRFGYRPTHPPLDERIAFLERMGP